MKIGYFLVISAAILWGTTGTSQGLAPDGASSAVLGALRILIGGLILFLYALLKGEKFNKGKWNIKVVFLGITMVACYQLSFFYGVKMAGVAVGTMIGIGSSPIFAGVLAKLFYHENITKGWVISTTLGIIGVVFISLETFNAQINMLGIFLCLLAGLSYTLYTLASKELLKDNSANAVMGVFFLGGAILLLPFLIFGNIKPFFTINGILVILHLGVFATAVSYFLFARGLKLIKISEASTLSLAEPLTATFLGVTILGENPNIYSTLGMFLIFFGLSLLVFVKKS
ncbi:MAG: EamA family transporter [Deferribacterales bacterium]|nr:EamA family transporter [Deferribacterales bacterium]